MNEKQFCSTSTLVKVLTRETKRKLAALFDKDSSSDDDMVKIIIDRVYFFDSDFIISLGLFFDSVSLLLVAHTLYNVTIDWINLYRESIASRRLQPLMSQE